MTTWRACCIGVCCFLFSLPSKHHNRCNDDPASPSPLFHFSVDGHLVGTLLKKKTRSKIRFRCMGWATFELFAFVASTIIHYRVCLSKTMGYVVVLTCVCVRWAVLMANSSMLCYHGKVEYSLGVLITLLTLKILKP